VPEDNEMSTRGRDASIADKALRKLRLDPSDSQNGDPESWEEHPVAGSEMDWYLNERPPHHGD
jgi:hypothetical protein